LIIIDYRTRELTNACFSFMPAESISRSNHSKPELNVEKPF
jgi:hypothetical protein